MVKEDRLKDLRSSSKEKSSKFYSWLDKNCVKATSHEEVRKILSSIKKPLKDIVDE